MERASGAIYLQKSHLLTQTRAGQQKLSPEGPAGAFAPQLPQQAGRSGQLAVFRVAHSSSPVGGTGLSVVLVPRPWAAPLTPSPKGSSRARCCRESVVSPLSSARTKRTAVAAISAKGWRTVVSGGEVQLDNGRSSKPTTLSWDGTRMCSIRGLPTRRFSVRSKRFELPTF